MRCISDGLYETRKPAPSLGREIVSKPHHSDTNNYLLCLFEPAERPCPLELLLGGSIPNRLGGSWLEDILLIIHDGRLARLRGLSLIRGASC
jgi:hypothetical protein